jgi:hypothetical protein
MTSPDPDRLRYAQIAGAVARHALGWRLTSAEEAAAVAELTEAAAGRADLLAERAGTALGFGEGRPDAARYRQIAELCIAAGADPAPIEQWIKVGRERAAAAAAIPYTGLPPGGLLLPARARRPAPRPGAGATAPARPPRVRHAPRSVSGFDERGQGPANVLGAADGGALLAGTAGYPAVPVVLSPGPMTVNHRPGLCEPGPIGPSAAARVNLARTGEAKPPPCRISLVWLSHAGGWVQITRPTVSAKS